MNHIFNKKIILPVMFICSPILSASEPEALISETTKTSQKVTANIEISAPADLNQEEPVPLVDAAVRYGMLANAYLNVSSTHKNLL